MIVHAQSPSGANADTADVTQAASDNQRFAWTAPSVTMVDLAKATLAMGPGVSDAGFLS